MTEWGLGLAAVVAPTAAVALTAWLNHRAHVAINQRIANVDARAERRAEADERQADAHRGALESIARDVSFLAGRQAERGHQR